MCLGGTNPDRMGGILVLRLVRDYSNIPGNFKFVFEEGTIRVMNETQRDFVVGYKEGNTNLVIKKNYWRNDWGVVLVDEE